MPKIIKSTQLEVKLGKFVFFETLCIAGPFENQDVFKNGI